MSDDQEQVLMAIEAIGRNVDQLEQGRYALEASDPTDRLFGRGQRVNAFKDKHAKADKNGRRSIA